MGRRYGDELAELVDTWDWARSAQASPAIADVRTRLVGGPAIFIGSGGALAVARLAADEHTYRTGHLGVATTPYMFANALSRTGDPVVLVSARARHPDVLAAARAASAGNAPLIALLTASDASTLDPRLQSAVDVVMTFPCPSRDGFLATNSVLAACTAWIRDGDTPEELPGLHATLALPDLTNVRRVIAVHGSRTASAAVDLEARLNETGLADVQLTDYRNLAHGRHVGLSVRAVGSLMAMFVDEPDRQVAQETRAIIGSQCAIATVSTPLPFPWSALDLTVQSMRLAGELAIDCDVDPGRPKVPAFGRKLYHMRWSKPLARRGEAAIQRKIAAAGGRPTDEQLRRMYERALSTWRRRVSATAFRGIVLDYDGTCCTTAGRFGLPPEPVQQELLRLLEEGLVLGFASGRGRSLHAALREWVPEKFWEALLVGLYNGSLRVLLRDDVPDSAKSDPALAVVADRLASAAHAFGMEVEVRPWQVTVTWSEPLTRAPARLREVVAALAGRDGSRVVVTSSAHSVDVIPIHAGKPAVLADMRSRTPGEILAIGDQGDVRGNDFELLASGVFTLSVDACSPDPTRCWNLGASAERGPDLLVRYLQAMSRRDGDDLFLWRLA